MELLVRLSPDLTIKSNKIRAKFVTRMLANMKDACKRAGFALEVQREWSRIFVSSQDSRLLETVVRIFGISSVSAVEHTCKAALDEIVRIGAAAYSPVVEGKTFAVRPRRVGKHTYTSADIGCELGAALRPSSRGVDLASPEVEIFVEVRDGVARLFSSYVRGSGGLPLGVSGKGLCLISGGFDSAVAAWLMQKRGVEMDYLFCNLGGPAYERSVTRVVKVLTDLWSSGTRPKLYILDFHGVAEEMQRKVKPSHSQVILKRMFYRVADAVARQTGAEALITGECVGQVSSQTLRNLTTIERVASRPVLRPLIGFDKEDILAIARKIGTFDLSAQIPEYCQLVNSKPVTACSFDAAKREEQDFRLELLEQALGAMKVVNTRDLSLQDLALPYIFKSDIPETARVIDCRPEEAYKNWHVNGAINVELHDLLAHPSRLDKLATYILYCSVGLQSAVAAERLQQAGYEVYSFKGGERALQTWLKGRGGAGA